MHLPTLRGLSMVFVFSAFSAYSAEPIDLAAIHRIKAEAFENSKVMEHVFYLTDANGPRVTNSPGFKSAGDWVVKRLQEYGLTDVHEEAWGPFGRGWSCTRFAAMMKEPEFSPLIGFAQQENISHVVFGQSARSRFDILLRGSVLNRFLSEVRDVTVQVVPMSKVKR